MICVNQTNKFTKKHFIINLIILILYNKYLYFSISLWLNSELFDSTKSVNNYIILRTKRVYLFVLYNFDINFAFIQY